MAKMYGDFNGNASRGGSCASFTCWNWHKCEPSGTDFSPDIADIATSLRLEAGEEINRAKTCGLYLTLFRTIYRTIR